MANLIMYTVYDHPNDYPNNFVCKEFRIGRGVFEQTGTFWLAPTLEQVRALIPVGMARLDRHPTDDPVIVETWL